ncbi:MAG: tRNA (guanosine(46)-N7)-methyltransferase TrmB [Flavobacteriaceae bacterium]|nr:MAG: tRNA (guanosine(46)-N7)-methyltransferase TrmB [Flavobacteriaceae bacterium]
MGKDKLRKFSENETFGHVIQPSREEVESGITYKGNWAQKLFNNTAPIVLELGCGKGEYTVSLAKAFPNKNFIGIDIKGARIWRGAKTADQEEISNVAFIRTQIELIDLLFEKGEIDEIWITFPDPQIKFRRAKHRLTHPEFLRKYFKVLKSEGLVHLKTDSEFLHGYTHGVLQIENQKIHFANHDVYQPHKVGIPNYVREIQTFYEKKYLEQNKPITYLQFSLKF